MPRKPMQVARRLPVLLLCLVAVAPAAALQPATSEPRGGHTIMPQPAVAGAEVQAAMRPRLGVAASERRRTASSARLSDDDDDDDEDDDDDSDALPGSV